MNRKKTARIMSLTIILTMTFSSIAMFAPVAGPSPPSDNSYVHPLTTFYHSYFNETGLPSGTQWSVTYDGNTLSSTTTTIEFTFTTSGTYSYSVPDVTTGTYLFTAFPSGGSLNSNGGTVSIQFRGANLTSSHSATDVNLKTWFYSELGSQSVPPLDYYVSFYIGSTNITTTTTNSSTDYTAAISHVFTTAGSYNIYMVWWAPAGSAPGSPYSFETPTISETVNPTLTVSISASQLTIDYGQSVTFNSNVTGGTPPYTYQWSLNGANVSGATSSTWTTSSLPVGSDSIRLWVTDSAGDPRPGIPDASIPQVIAQTGGASSSYTYYVGDVFNLSLDRVGHFALHGNITLFDFQWYANGVLIPGATHWWLSTAESNPGTYYFQVAVGTNRSGMYHGVYYGGAWITIRPNVLPANSVEFVESGLPIGAVWSAELASSVVPYGNTISPIGPVITGVDGLYTTVEGNGLPTVIITPPNGTYYFFINDYRWGQAWPGFYCWQSPGNYTANITSGMLTFPLHTANGSIIIHVRFTPINNSPNKPLNQTNKTTRTLILGPDGKLKVEQHIMKNTVPAENNSVLLLTRVSPVKIAPFLGSTIFVPIIFGILIRRSIHKKQRNEGGNS